ncbi:hypothetical protein TNIN_226351 [Trichonephila inaurata madagascariensis]|uniref:Uncharacterized protein n=1 Tax=Trichonephila inaurata madagascariensis TaxID=2747483 RepID=A0A8X7C8H0_9ARAC|nr:hypothetical protein TNIN_226351 [Trichonephila inaurata madagascariensis]
MDKSNETLDKSNESLEPKPLEPELVDKSNETLDKSNESVELKPLEPELMDTSNETLEQELMDHCLMDTTNEEKPLKPMDKSNEEKPLEHCDGEGCREAVYKSVEYCPKESLNYVDKSMVENTNKEFIVELMKRVNEAMECSDSDIVAMECCEELLSNVEIILDEKATELENVEVDKKEVNVERAQPEKAMESNVDHDEK